MSVVSYQTSDRLAIISANNPPVNALSHAVRQGLMDGIERAGQDETVDAIVIACEGRTFFAGADITEFGKPPQAPHLPDVVNAIEASEKPVVAALHGTVLGGGFEVALACHYRTAARTTKLGLPEVHLGLLPGAGGTQRLPRLIGVEAALDAILSGRHMAVGEAALAKAVDDLTDGDPLEAAKVVALKQVGQPIRRTGEMTVDSGAYDADWFAAFRAKTAPKFRGYFAAELCIQCVEAAVSLPIDGGMACERALFQDCLKSAQSSGLRHMFFADRQISRIPGISKETASQDIKSVGIIGAGTMGGGIAMSFAKAGIEVQLVDMSDDALDRGLGIIKGNYGRSVKRGSLSENSMAEQMRRIKPTTDYGDLGGCDLVIEAVFESMDVKKQVMQKLDASTKPEAILATNTSYLNVNEIAAVTTRPEQVLGLHFFSPANVMKLLEIVRADKTSDEVLKISVALSKRLGKVGVVSGVCHGFIGNRMLGHYAREAALCVIEGASPEDVDKALYAFGFPMGPLTVSDMAGLDIGYMNRQSMGRETYETAAFDWMDQLVEQDRKGLKVGAGIYDYEPGNRTPKPSQLTADILSAEREKLGITPRDISAEEIVERTQMALINEGAKILEEGIALRASDIDVVYCNGYGYPRYRGGPMHYGDHLSLKTVYEKILKLQDKVGPRWWIPSKLLEQLAQSGSSFASHDAAQSG